MNKNDWHPADILAALKKRGTSLSAVSRAAGLASSTLANALVRPWAKGEWLIAQGLSLPPSHIWPSRYANTILPRVPKKSPAHKRTDKQDVSPAMSPHTKEPD